MANPRSQAIVGLCQKNCLLKVISSYSELARHIIAFNGKNIHLVSMCHINSSIGHYHSVTLSHTKYRKVKSLSTHLLLILQRFPCQLRRGLANSLMYFVNNFVRIKLLKRNFG